jgi:HAMP domain-containing protein
MKRSTTGRFTKNKKLCRSSSPTFSEATHNFEMSNTLQQIKDMVLHLDKGDLEYCLSQQIARIVGDEEEQEEEEEEEDISILLHKALKNIAKRQLRLETENKRYRIAIKQQHQLLTQQQSLPPEEEEEEKVIEKEPVVNNNGTPEDCISSVRQSPMLEKLELSSPLNDDLITYQADDCQNCVNQAVQVVLAVHDGQLDQRITCNHSKNNALKIAVNSMADQLQRITQSVLKVAHETAVDGKLGVQAECDDSMEGVWRDFILNLNSMTRNHLNQVRDIADVSTAIARGDLSKAMTVPVNGETLMLKNTFNTMGKPPLVKSLLYCTHKHISQSFESVCF